MCECELDNLHKCNPASIYNYTKLWEKLVGPQRGGAKQVLSNWLFLKLQ